MFTLSSKKRKKLAGFPGYSTGFSEMGKCRNFFESFLIDYNTIYVSDQALVCHGEKVVKMRTIQQTQGLGDSLTDPSKRLTSWMEGYMAALEMMNRNRQAKLVLRVNWTIG